MQTARFLMALFLLQFFAACQKDAAPANDGPYDFKYSESLLTLRDKDYTVLPAMARSGRYTAFPDNLNLNEATGAITVTQKGKDGKESQTGLRYQVYFASADGSVKDTTNIVLAGINYQDQLYYQSRNDSVCHAIYNANPTLEMPPSVFTSSNNKLAINPATGSIQLKKTIANGFFNDDPQNDDWRVVTINQETSVNGKTIKNGLDVVIYFYKTVNDIPSNVSEVMRAHQRMIMGVTPVDIPQTSAAPDESIRGVVSASKPRPPCLIIVGN